RLGAREADPELVLPRLLHALLAVGDVRSAEHDRVPDSAAAEVLQRLSSRGSPPPAPRGGELQRWRIHHRDAPGIHEWKSEEQVLPEFRYQFKPELSKSSGNRSRHLLGWPVHPGDDGVRQRYRKDRGVPHSAAHPGGSAPRV